MAKFWYLFHQVGYLELFVCENPNDAIVQNATREIASFIGRAPKLNTSGDEAGFILTPNSPSMATFNCELLKTHGVVVLIAYLMLDRLLT